MAVLQQTPLPTTLFAAGLPLSSFHIWHEQKQRLDRAKRGGGGGGRRRRRSCRLLAERKACCKDEGKGVARRHLTALLAALSTHMLLVNRNGSSAPIPTNESEQFSQGMLEGWQKRVNSLGMSAGSASKSTSYEMHRPVIKNVASFPDEKAIVSEKSTEQRQGGSNGISFLNSLTVVGAGILGALYFSERQQKAASDMAFRDATSKLRAREDAMLSLREKLEGDLLAEKEKALKQSKKAQELISLLDELAATRKSIDDLEKQLDTEKSMVQKLEENIEGLQIAAKEAEEQNAKLKEKLDSEQGKIQELESEIRKANDMMKAKEQEIASLHSALDGKEKALAKLSSRIHETAGEVSQAKSKLQLLERERSTLNKILMEKETTVKDLHSKLVIAVAQGKETEKLLATVHHELESLKLLSGKQLEEAKNNMSLNEAEFKELMLKLTEASEAREKNSRIICNLSNEIDALKHKLNEENSMVEHLKGELSGSLQEVENMKKQVASLSQELESSRELKEKLDQRVADLQMDADANISSLNEALSQERKMSSQIKNELELVQKELDNLKVEAASLVNRSKELKVLRKERQGDIFLSQESTKGTIAALEEQKELTLITKKQLEVARRAITEANENIKLLHNNVEKDRTELENVNKEVLLLAEKLEAANGKAVSLEAEKAILIQSLDEERKVNNDLKDRASQVDLALAKLSKEKGTSAKRVKKLEVDLASVKGEMIQLKKQATMMDATLEEAKSQVRTIAQNKELADAAENTSEMEVLKSELSKVQMSQEHVEKHQVEAELEAEIVQNGASKNKITEKVSVVYSVGRQGADE